MTKHILNIAFVLLGLHNVQAQYSYFNQISGEIGDLSSEITANIEVVNDGYVIWGALVDDGVLKHYVRKYGVDGEIVDENVLEFENEYFYTGITNSMQWNLYTEQFIVLQGSVVDDGVSARLLSFDTNLELNQDLVYNEYSPNTYFFGFLIEEDGYVIYGEYGPFVNGEGTFIMKLDFEGNVVWNEVMQTEVNQVVYRNYSIVSLGDEGYLVAGGGVSGNPFGLVTVVNMNGIPQSEIEVQYNDELRTNHFKACKLLNGEILQVQNIGYELMDEDGNPNVFWSKTRLTKFDLESETLYGEVDYFDNYEMRGGPNDLEPTSDGGAVILGGRYGLNNDLYAWILKVDVDGNQEWFQEYTYETCDNCWNLLYDIEVAPDGGYVAAGNFNNSIVDVRDNPWLLKVDACGELEWQGCAPVGVEEKEPQSFSVYPNPSGGVINIVTESQTQLEAYAIYDLSGRNLDSSRLRSKSSARLPAYSNGQIQIELNLPNGLYALELVMDDGKRENHKIQIVR